MITTKYVSRPPPPQLVVIQAAAAYDRQPSYGFVAAAAAADRRRLGVWLYRHLRVACNPRTAPALLCSFALAHAIIVFVADSGQPKGIVVSESLRAAAPRVNIVTLVTAYWNVGEFQPTSYSIHRHPGLYREWLSTFADILNPVVALFDEPEVAQTFAEIRRGLPTKIILVRKEDLWSFRLQPRVQAVLDAPDYPKSVPTTYAAYDCANHAKYDAVELAIRDDHFHTAYVAWIDVGMFREVADGADRRQFAIEVPPHHQSRYVAYNQVYDFDARATVSAILRNGLVWVGGGFFLGTVEAVAVMCAEYRKFTELFLERNLTLADQSVLYAMYATDNAVRPAVGIQAFLPDSRYNPWFSLCFVMRERWLEKVLPIPFVLAADNGSAAGG